MPSYTSLRLLQTGVISRRGVILWNENSSKLKTFVRVSVSELTKWHGVLLLVVQISKFELSTLLKPNSLHPPHCKFEHLHICKILSTYFVIMLCMTCYLKLTVFQIMNHQTPQKLDSSSSSFLPSPKRHSYCPHQMESFQKKRRQILIPGPKLFMF